MKYYLDTEFQEGFHEPLFGKRRHFIDLISIGIVAEDGREYYAISNEFDLKRVWKDEWLRANVLGPIHEELCRKESVFAKTHFWELFAPFTLKSMENLIKWHGKPNKEIAAEITCFCYPDQSACIPDSEFLDRAKKFGWNAPHPEFYAYFADYDWVVFCSLFGRMIDLPAGFPFYCRDLKQTLDEKVMALEGFAHGAPLENRLNRVKMDPDYPKQEDEHNALADARWNRRLHEFLRSI